MVGVQCVWPILNGWLGAAPEDCSPGLREGYGILRILTRMLLAFDKSHPSIGYMQGMAPVAATLLLHMPEEQAYWTFVKTYTGLLQGIVTKGSMTFGLDAFKGGVHHCLKLVRPNLVEHLEAVDCGEGCPSLLQSFLDMYVIQMGLGLFVDLEQVVCCSVHVLIDCCSASFALIVRCCRCQTSLCTGFSRKFTEMEITRYLQLVLLSLSRLKKI